MGKFLHKFFTTVVYELNNSLPNLVKSGSEVSHFISEPNNFAEVTRVPAHIKKSWLKETLKEIKKNNQKPHLSTWMTQRRDI